ncbi:MAG: cytidine deaminase [Thermoanaerobaculia bacterium]
MRDGERLIEAAREARGRAIAPYSNYRVGAALRTRDGEIVQGCNIENATYGLTVCAERVALLTALAAGRRDFESLAVVSQSPEPATPCGPCRQLLWEYCGDIEVVTANLEGETCTYRLAELLPHPFTLPEENR